MVQHLPRSKLAGRRVGEITDDPHSGIRRCHLAGEETEGPPEAGESLVSSDGARSALAEHRGRIVKTSGDALLVEFAIVVGAVRYGIEARPARAGLTVPA